ncbi:hypothetical protein ACGFYY_39685 [Streptomyces sp. NPDC048331]|uniref:hypothetical protein n=1 Tax=Streptomyces sp. NPDC048331 TaxID=3365534 RepID=UPI0037126067
MPPSCRPPRTTFVPRERENVLRPVTVAGGVLVATLVAGRLLDLLLPQGRRPARRDPLWGLLCHWRLPCQVVLCTSPLRRPTGRRESCTGTIARRARWSPYVRLLMSLGRRPAP